MGNVDQKWLSMAEVCSYLGVSRDTIKKWISENNMPANKIGKLWRFSVGEIDDWVKSNSVKITKTK